MDNPIPALAEISAKLQIQTCKFTALFQIYKLFDWFSSSWK